MSDRTARVISPEILAMYLGCEVITPDGRGILVGLPWQIKQQTRVSIHFGSRMVKTKNSIDGGYDKTRNHGDYLIEPEHFTPMHESELGDIHLPGGVKPILRRLEDMTEEEAKETWMVFSMRKIPVLMFTPEQTALLLSKHFDLFELIDSGLALDSKLIQK